MSGSLPTTGAGTQDARREARRMVFRGAGPDAVRAFLHAHGVPEHATGELLRKFTDEREASIRRTGVDYIVGGIFAMIGVVVASILFHLPGGKMMLLIGALGFGGVIKGTTMLFRRDDGRTDLTAMMPRDLELESAAEAPDALTKSLPPLVGYGLLFGSVAVIVLISAWLMYF